MANRLLTFGLEVGGISNRSFGFIKGVGCGDAMAYLIEKMSMNMRDTHALLVDFHAAFDTVNHGLLLEKMERVFELDGAVMDYLLAALCDRFGKVVIDGESKGCPGSVDEHVFDRKSSRFAH